jgi:hypothetical protein
MLERTQCAFIAYVHAEPKWSLEAWTWALETQ